MSTGQTDYNSALVGKRAQARRAFYFAAVGLLLAAPSVCRVAQAQTSAGYSSDNLGAVAAGPSIDLDVANASLLSVVQALKQQSQAQIVVVNSKEYQPVTLTVTASLADALKYVAQSAGAIVTRDSNGVYTFRPMSSASDQAAAFYANYQPQAAAPPVPQEAMHTERIVLQYVDPNYILVMLNDPAGYRDTNPITNPLNSPYGPPRISEHINSANPSLIEIDPYAATNTGASEQPGVPLQNGNYAGAATQANRSEVQNNGTASQFIPGQFPGGVSPNQGFGASGGVVNPYQQSGQGQIGTTFGGTPTAPGQATSLRPQGIDSIISNEEDNALIVRGTPEGITELKQIIGFLDRAPRQVQIKVEFITTDVATVDQFGINWSVLPFPNVAAGFNGGATTTASSVQTGSSYLTFAQGNIATELLATLTSTNSKVVAAPIITTTNNVGANIDFSSEIPFTTTNTVAQGSGNTINSSTVQFLNITNRLIINPRINGDDSVSLSLNPQLTSITGTGSPPPTTTQSVQTYRTVANGETMVIGGLVQKNVATSKSGIPFLSQLPIIGSLFRTHAITVSDSELLIFVTPTVLPPIGSGLATTPSEAGEATSGDSSSGVGVTP